PLIIAQMVDSAALQKSTQRPRMKFRLSCDRCRLRKVKCSQEKPSCLYCRSRDLQCDYSISAMHGRRPKPAMAELTPDSSPTVKRQEYSAEMKHGEKDSTMRNANNDIELDKINVLSGPPALFM